MKRRLIKMVALLALCAMSSGLLVGCIASIGGGSKERMTSAHPTRGQELIDLKEARDKGAITPEEYDNQKTRILER